MDKRKLVERCQEGDRQALGLLYRNYADRMQKVCACYVHDEQAVQDILHDGFIIIFSSIATLQSPDKLESWMGTIMRNLALRYLKQDKTDPTISLDELSDEEDPGLTTSDDNLPTYESMLQLIERLPEGYGKIFRLSVLEGLSHKEIGALLGIAPHSSSSQLSRAKALLRKLLSTYRFFGLLLILLIVILFRLYRVAEEHPAESEDVWVSGSQQNGDKPEVSLSADTSRHVPVQLVDAREHSAMEVTEQAPHPSQVLPRNPVRHEEDILPVQKRRELLPPDEDAHSHGWRPSYGQPRKRGGWSLALSYVNGTGQTNLQQKLLPGGIGSALPTEVVEKAHHHVPLTVSLAVQKRFNHSWSLETGVQYTYLHSDFTLADDVYTERVQKLHYLGIPLKGTLTLWRNNRFSLYTSVGMTLEIPVKASGEEFVFEGNRQVQRNSYPLHPSWQWSTHWGLGLQYQLTPKLGLYVEPGLHYYLKNGDGIETLRTEKPFECLLPVGIRFSW